MCSERETKEKLGRVKLIVFDIGNTIVDAERLVLSCAKYAADRMCLEIGCNQPVLVKAYQSSSKLSSHKHINRIFSDPKIVRKALREAGIVEDEHSIYLFLTFFRKHLRNLLTRDERLIQILSSFRQYGLSLCVVSDGTTIEQYELLESIGVLALFDHVFISESYAEEKTSTKLFEAILDRCSFLADQSLMVGDDIERDMFWAHKTGYTTILQEEYVTPPEHLLERLRYCVDYRVKSLPELHKLILQPQ